MALSVVTIRPNSTPQLGDGTVSGAASAHAALADSSDTSYVQLSGRCRLDDEVVRVGFPTPSLPAGAKVYSVTLRRRVQTVTVTAGEPRLSCFHWFRCLGGSIVVAGQLQEVLKRSFNSPCPTSTTSAWVEETVGTFTAGPGGQAWDVATNLTGLTYDIGRDSHTQTLRVSAVYLDITYQQESSVTVTGPTGTISDTRPTVTWTYSSPDSQPQQAYRVAVYTAAQVAAPGFAPFVSTPTQASGILGGTPAQSWWVLGEDLQWTLTADLVDGAYSVYVQSMAQWSGIGEFTTDIASATFTRAVATATPEPPVDPPPAAVLLSVAQESADSPRMRLEFEPGGSTPATVAFTVEVSVDNGITWEQPPSLRHIPADGTNPVVAFHNTPDLNVDLKYRVIAFSGTPLVAAATPSNEITAQRRDDRYWLLHPTDWMLSTPIVIAHNDDGIKVTKRRMMGTFYPVSGPGQKVLPFIIFGPSYGDEYELELLFNHGEPSMDYWPAVDQLGRTDSVLKFQKPDGTSLWVGMGPGGSGRDTEETFRAVPGNIRVDQQRRRKITLTESRSPSFY